MTSRLARLVAVALFALFGLMLPSGAIVVTSAQEAQAYPCGSQSAASVAAPPDYNSWPPSARVQPDHRANVPRMRGSLSRADAVISSSHCAYDANVEPATVPQEAVSSPATTRGEAETSYETCWVLRVRCVAAKAVPEALSFGSRTAAREGLPGDLAGVGNRFFRGATSKSQEFQAIGLPDGGYRLQFFSPANNPGYGKLYVQEIDRSGNILSRYKDTMGPDGLIERKTVQ